MDFQFKKKYSMQDLLDIMAILRSSEGCPWDREQTHQSIRNCFIEETYEAVEAIDNEDTELLKEELGDVLLQVLFHSQLEKESGRFDFSDVVDGIAQKMIIRHPHVFGSTVVNSSDEVLVNWDAIKKETKKQATQTEVLQSVSKALPALMRSAKVQHKAAKVGFDWPDISGALDKVAEETCELKEAIDNGSWEDRMEELGDLLFSVVNVSRFLKVEPEQALSFSCDKFILRFQKMEQLAKERGADMASLSLEQLDSLWNEAKTN
ncbi:nucleoside triphosphate pyrophosphohydrolase [Caproiciproducens sp. R2]|uniref:nucleoside triphosphate pyrophosphohydrolase n=1 Tax=Caproiciproducens sp. R2 TaxID=3435187 RepID=UPI004033E7BC